MSYSFQIHKKVNIISIVLLHYYKSDTLLKEDKENMIFCKVFLSNDFKY